MTSRRSRQVLSLLFALPLLAAGCATSYEMKVDAISRPVKTTAKTVVTPSVPTPTEEAAAILKEPVSYRIRNKSTTEEDGLRHKEAVELVKTALSAKGLYEAPDPKSADMVVEVEYGMEKPRMKMVETSVPKYAQVGGGIRYDQIVVTDARGNVTTRTVPVYEAPRTELIGYEDVLVPVTVYEKYLRISARENKEAVEGRPPAEIWSVNVTNEDESGDLRKYLPLLASASADYIGQDSSTQKTVKIKPTDEVVGFIKKGL